MQRLTIDRLSRRTSLAALSAAVAASTGLPLVSQAKQSPGKKARKKCKRQVSVCNTEMSAFCQGQDNTADCLSRVQVCCEFTGTCNFSGFLTCFAQQSSS